MKKATWIIIAAVALSFSVYAQTEIRSENAVGYVKVEAPKGTLNLISHNFDSIDGQPVTVANLLGDQVPVGSAVFIWDKNAQKYTFENNLILGWNPGTNVLQRGLGFWLKIPDTAPSNSYNVYLMGEVPESTNANDNTVSGLMLAGFPYPVQIAFTNTALAQNASIGDKLYYWKTNQQYGYVNRLIIGWNPNDFVIEPGMGFWYQTANPQAWDETKPYTWP